MLNMSIFDFLSRNGLGGPSKGSEGPPRHLGQDDGYRAPLMVWYNPLRTNRPKEETAPMQTAAMRASMRPYSTIVAPSSAQMNLLAPAIKLSPQWCNK